MQNFLNRELDWIRKPASARQAKNQARVKAYEKVLREREGIKKRVRENENLI